MDNIKCHCGKTIAKRDDVGNIWLKCRCDEQNKIVDVEILTELIKNTIQEHLNKS